MNATSDYNRPDGALRASAIKRGMKSMRHMRAAMLGQAGDTAAMRWGRLVHLAILEPDRYARLPVWGAGRRYGKDWDRFVAELDGADYLQSDEVERLRSMRAAVMDDRAARSLLGGASCEQLVRWTDPLLGACKAKLDGVAANGSLVEIKTTRDLTDRRFMQQCESLGYHVQLGWYDRARAESGTSGRPAWVIAIECPANSEPTDVAVYRVDPAVIQQGYETAREIGARYRACEAAGGPFLGVSGGMVLEYRRPTWATGAVAGEVDLSSGEMEADAL